MAARKLITTATGDLTFSVLRASEKNALWRSHANGIVFWQDGPGRGWEFLSLPGQNLASAPRQLITLEREEKRLVDQRPVRRLTPL